jgi:magnesium transporter
MKLPASDFIRIMKRKAGHPPGELIPPGEQAQDTRIKVITFNEKSHTNTEVDDPGEITALLSEDTTNWVHVRGFRQTEVFRKIGELFQINPLSIEDSLNQEHLPKAEEMEDQLFVTLKSIAHNQSTGEYFTNHLSFILKKNLIISIAQFETDIFDGFIDRIGRAVGKIRQRKEDYILYRLMDITIDNYFLVFEDLEGDLFDKEEKLVEGKLDQAASQITAAKKEIYYMKKFLVPTTEALFILMKSETNLIKKQNRGFYTDILDHLKHMLQALEGYREIAISLMELHTANSANRMNEVMKTLTIIATIFIPLTFIAGIYGMNFEYMPELAIKWAYPVLMLFMLVLGVGMFLFMKRKKWF